MNRFEERLQSDRPLLLDGGLATQIESRGAALHPTLWSAGLLHSAPGLIKDAHAAFLAAGAEVLATASYQGSRSGFTSLGMDAAAADALMRSAVSLAQQAISEADRPEVLVAASLGPWGATRADGSEYTGRYAASEQDLRNFHGERLALMDDSGADVLALETIPQLGEARVLAGLLRQVQTPAWVSFCCRDDALLSDGTPVEEAAQLFKAHPRVKALGINCTAPRFVPGLLKRLQQSMPGLPVLVYPNSGEKYDAHQGRWHGTVSEQAAGSAALDWIKQGARGVGGCCRMGAGHIETMAQAINKETSP